MDFGSGSLGFITFVGCNEERSVEWKGFCPILSVWLLEIHVLVDVLLPRQEVSGGRDILKGDSRMLLVLTNYTNILRHFA